MLFACVEQRMLQNSDLTPNDAVLAVRVDTRLLIESILRLLPNTTNIVVVFGNSPLEKFWTREFDRTIKEFAPGVGSELFGQLSFEEMKSRAAKLPPHSAIFIGGIMVDARGIPQTQHSVRDLHSVANAPMFGLRDYELGNGIVGGPLQSIRELSNQSALAAARLLNGESPSAVRPPPMGLAQPTYDWRELRRWRIPLASLPPDARIEFRELSTLERYKWHIITILSVCVAQAILISLLLRNLAKRRRAERSLREGEERMSLAADAGRLGMWVWDPHSSQFWVTDKWKELHGCITTEDIQYETWIARIHPEDRQALENALSNALKKQSGFHMEHRIVLPDGTIRWMSKSGRVERVSDGAPARLLGISIDITERKENEAAARVVGGKLITAQEDERKRIARDLHDDLSQRLAMLSFEMHLLGSKEKDAADKELIQKIVSQVTDVSSEVHQLSYQLHPAKLDQLGFVAATRSLCHEFSKRSDISVEFEYETVSKILDQKIALCLYRIVQEALQNTIKHSQATRAHVFLHEGTDFIRLVVSDNGQGFDMRTESRCAGLGLVGMRERIKLVDGKITLNSAPGYGTDIHVIVPVAINPTNKASACTIS